MLAECHELVVPDGQNDGGVLPLLGQSHKTLQTVCLCGLGHVDPRVVHIDAGVVGLQGGDDVHYFGVTQIRAIFLEREAQYQHPAGQHRQVLAQHELHRLIGHVTGHAVVDAPPRQYDLGVVTHLLGLVGQVIGVHTDAVAAHQPWPEWQKIPLGSRRLQHLQGVYAQLAKDQAEFVHQRNIHIPLGVLDDLGRLRYPDAAGLVSARGDDLPIEPIDIFRDLRGAATGNFSDAG